MTFFSAETKSKTFDDIALVVPFMEISQYFSEHVYGTPYDPYELSNLISISLGLILLSVFAIFKYI